RQDRRRHPRFRLAPFFFTVAGLPPRSFRHLEYLLEDLLEPSSPKIHAMVRQAQIQFQKV
ncbi:MAG: hypothetical protein ACOYD3_09545, partial [Kiritimatiellia bacterium]